MKVSHSLANLFQIEKETHLAVLSQEFQLVVRGEDSTESLQKMFRAAHSLKGAARLISDATIEKVAHELEDFLSTITSLAAMTKPELELLAEAIKKLGGQVDESQQSVAGGQQNGLLHITSSHIAEVINLACELAVMSRRTDSLVELACRSGANNQILTQEARQCSEHAAGLAQQLQQVCYRLRLAPLLDVTKSLPVIAETVASQLGKEVRCKTINGSTLVDRELLRKIEPSLIQLLKNSIDHGLESPADRVASGKSPCGTIQITARQYGASIEIEFKDDGQGVDLESVRSKVIERAYIDRETAARLSDAELLEFLFLPGFSTRTEVNIISGRGLGLDIVKATLKELGGDVTLTSLPKQGTVFLLKIPSRVSSFRALICTAGACSVAIPLAFIQRIVQADVASCRNIGSFKYLCLEGQDVPIINGGQLMGVPRAATGESAQRIVVIVARGKALALAMDEIAGEEGIVVQPLDARFSGMKKILGLAGGVGNKIITVINPEEIVSLPLSTLAPMQTLIETEKKVASTKRILIVDDSLTVRELERRVLAQAGFDCQVAIDGVEGFNALIDGAFDLVITDLDMPRMTGFDLIESTRRLPKYSSLPLLVVSYKERQEDKERCLNLGATAYLSKGSFRDDSFLKTVKKLLSSGGQGE